MGNYYHIYISARTGVTLDEIKKEMDLALDWYRYNNHNWVVYTTSDSKKWYSRLQKFVEPGGHVFIIKLDKSDFWGLMNKGLWEWLEKTR
jgi:hypothetical protein